MSLRVTFEINDRDLAHFRECMHKARDAVRDADDEDIVAAARDLFEEVSAAKAPVFVKRRIQYLHAMTGMLEDDDWLMPEQSRSQVLSALVYFCDPEDMIPDEIPGLGFLDDAIMIELVFRELRHEIEAYEDFCEFRTSYDNRFRITRDPKKRAERLAKRRDGLLERVERRRAKEVEQVDTTPTRLF